MKGIELALRFSYITNRLRFCGPKEAASEFLSYLNNQDNADTVEDCLKRFEGLYPYLSVIAKKAQKDFLDTEVVEAYWIGNDLLEKSTESDIVEIITQLTKRGLPKSLGEKLIKNLPRGLVPHHNFNVFYVGVGNTTGAVPTTLQNMDNCRTSWGTVIEVLHEKLIVNTPTLTKSEDNKFILEDEIKTIIYLPEMIPKIEKGEIVAIHWGFAPMILSSKQLVQIEKYTHLIIDIMNKN